MMVTLATPQNSLKKLKKNPWVKAWNECQVLMAGAYQSAYICMYQIEGVSGDAAISFSAPSSYPAPSYTTNQPTTFIF
jgi:hypothetical protein